jgi:integrase
MADNSTLRTRSRKRLAKSKSLTEQLRPYPGFPLSAHASGAWQKKVNGTTRYYGKWGVVRNGKLERLPDDGWKAALAEYEQHREADHAGRARRIPGDELTLRDICNSFLTAKKQLLDAGEITVRSFGEYRETTDRLIRVFGKDRVIDHLNAEDFQHLRADIQKTCGPVRLGNVISRVRTVFKYGYESGLIEKPVRFGPMFKRPGKSVLRKHRAKTGERMFEPDELRAMLKEAHPQLRAMIYLGLNAGLGNHDCGLLREQNLNLKTGWLNYPRSKTGIARRAHLWPETVAAIREAIDSKPEPKNKADSDRVFLLPTRVPWTADAKIYSDSTAEDKLKVGPRVDEVTKAFRRLLDELNLHKHGLGFYTLRHVFETVAGGSTDQVAVNLVMGHADQSMADTYRERIDDHRLVAVVDHVHRWLFGSKKGGAK